MTDSWKDNGKAWQRWRRRLRPPPARCRGWLTRTAGIRGLLRQLVESVADEMMGAEADELCVSFGNGRNVYRERKLLTCVGTLTLRFPSSDAEALLRCLRSAIQIVPVSGQDRGSTFLWLLSER